MTDRELLELAAKAAGYRINISNNGTLWISHNDGRSWDEWNPLTDDGDALRLAVKLSMRVDIELEQGITFVHTDRTTSQSECNSNDPYAATRRAIVRAAAEIGKAM